MAFFNIVKANAEITRLTSALADAEAKNKELLESQPEALKLAEASLAESETALTASAAALTKAQTDLATAISERDAAKAKAAGVDDEVKTKAAQAAAAIVAAQGAKAIEASADASKGDIVAELNAITDPAQRTAFVQKNRAALFAANKK